MSEILIIEDDEDIRLTAIEFLEMEGIVAIGASNGKTALDYLAGCKKLPKLILVDISMPVMDGPGFREAQLKDERLNAIPCAVMSADGRVDAKSQALGITMIVKKPIDLDALLELAQRHLVSK